MSDRAPSRWLGPWRRAETGAAAARAILHALVDGLPGPAAILGGAGGIEKANAALTARLRASLPPGSDGGSPPPEVVMAWARLCADATRTGASAIETVPWPGTDVSYHTIVTPLLGPPGSPEGFLLQAKDDSEGQSLRRRAAELEAELQVRRDILDRIPDQIYAKDAQHRFVIANGAVAMKILGRADPAGLLGKTDHDFFPRKDADGYRADERRLMEMGQDLIDLEEKAVYQGRETWNLTSKLLQRDGHGAVVGIVGINRDITARRLAEQALAAERNLLVSLMDSLPDLIFFKDLDSRFTAINTAYAGVLGLSSPAEAVGRTIADFLGRERFLESRREEQELYASGRALIGKEEPVVFPQGGRRWMMVSKVALRDAHGRTTGLVGVSRDITDRKTAEEDLARGLEEFLKVASAVSEGDLSRRGRAGTDTLGRIAAEVNHMLDRISGMLLQVRRLAESVSLSAAEIRIASDEIARGAQRQSEETLATSASAEEMARSMAGVTRGAEEAASRAGQVEETAREGDRLAREASGAMARIEQAVASSVERMRHQERASQEILDVVETIKDFADQTNLLSLNAAIEAARAGNAGSGFSVIADAIRELADKSAKAARDVDLRLGALQAGTAEALAAMQESTQETRTGLERVGDSLAALRSIASAVEVVFDRTEAISTAVREQTQVTDDLARRIQTFAAIAAQTSAAAEETARTVTTMVRMADDLRDALGRFRLGDGQDGR